MTTSSIVSFALVMVILLIHVMNACPLSTGLCKQYGHSCLGGHGKRSENQNALLLKYLLKEMYDSPKEEFHLPQKDSAESKEWESLYEKKPKLWDSDSDDSLRANLFN